MTIIRNGDDFTSKLNLLGREVDRVFNGGVDVPIEERKAGFLLLAFPLRDDGGVEITTNMTGEALIDVVDKLKDRLADIFGRHNG